MNANEIRRLRNLVAEINNDGQGLTDWEKDFVKSATEREHFSPKQAEIIEKIYKDRVGEFKV